MVKDNKLLGEFELMDIPPSPRGIPQIEVKFKIDVNGTINVSANDKKTSKSQSIKINKPGLSESEIQQKVKEAEQFVEEDKKRKETVNEKNKLDSMVYRVEKLISDSKDKLSDELIEAAKKSIASSKECLKNEYSNINNFQSAFQDINTISRKIGEAIYKASKNNSSTDTDKANDAETLDKDLQDGGDNKKKKNEDDVIDVDFKNV